MSRMSWKGIPRKNSKMGVIMFDNLIDDMITATYMIMALAFSAGALAMWGIPKLWMWVKPMIHALTA